ncbi:MAG TPA: UDP-N-acetylmuramoyl-L-alanine--D-glutamate ligase [Patescibacteria group bacterium]|nr:UDP-N-acetylmuramoyl-L-alanine--D-glutamate ligase [Patescibacteria group bacterium]
MDLSKISSFQDAVVTLMGLGRYKQGSGIGAAKWLMRHGAQLVITDLKSEEELKESVEEVTGWYERYKKEYPGREIYAPVFVLGEHRAENFTDVDLVVQNPGVPRESAFVKSAKERGISVESDMSLFFRFCPFPIYAVTGTRGKSTTTALIGEMFKQKDPRTVVAGNIAVSPLEFLDELMVASEPTPIILELSSWLIESLGNVRRGPDIAVFTNVYEDHLNRYASFADYIASKEALFVRQGSDQWAVLNFEHEIVRGTAGKTEAKKMWFAKEGTFEGDGAYVQGGFIVFRKDGSVEPVFPTSEIKLQGDHNLQNVLAAVCVGKIAGLSNEQMAEALRTFGGLPGRQEVVREVNGITYVNDTTATSPDGAIAALERFGEGKKVVLIAGGASKNLPFDKLGEEIGRTCKTVVLLEGDATDALDAAIGDTVLKLRADSMAKAVEAASSAAQFGDVVLLSPGTASFGMFKNEYDRGDQFVEAVRGL